MTGFGPIQLEGGRGPLILEGGQGDLLLEPGFAPPAPPPPGPPANIFAGAIWDIWQVTPYSNTFYAFAYNSTTQAFGLVFRNNQGMTLANVPNNLATACGAQRNPDNFIFQYLIGKY